jgi:hypothetical protein
VTTATRETTAGTATVSRRRLRIATGAVALACSLALTACGGGDGGSDDTSSGDPSASASADTGGTSGGSPSTSSSAGKLAGSWLATTDGKAVALVVNGTAAGVFTTGGSVCSGTAKEEAGMQMLRLKCTDGSKDRAVGMVDSVGKSTLKVTWQQGIGSETFTRTEGGTLPSGLPTAGLGS